MPRGSNSEAWAWVLAHKVEIRRICDKARRGWPSLDREDYHHTVLVRIVERWDRIDHERHPLEWVRWQAVAARTSHSKARARKMREVEVVYTPGWDSRSVDDSARAIEARIDATTAQRLASPDEWAAVTAKADGYAGEDLAARLGCAPFSATRRARRLAARLS